MAKYKKNKFTDDDIACVICLTITIILIFKF